MGICEEELEPIEKSYYLVKDGNVSTVSEVPDWATDMWLCSLSFLREPTSFVSEVVNFLVEKETLDKFKALLRGLDKDACHSLIKSLVDANQWGEYSKQVYDILKDLGLFSSHCNQPEGE